MIYPIVAWGHPILKKRASDIEASYPKLKELIEDMFETMYAASGIGLAAPQINLSIRIIVIDASVMGDEDPSVKDFKRVFINPEIISFGENIVSYSEGCLSVPGIHEDVNRADQIRLRYRDENFEAKEEVFEAYQARVVQHEYDHIEGKTFVDRLHPLRRTMLRRRLESISKGLASADYRMIFPARHKK